MSDAFTNGMPKGFKTWTVGFSLASPCCWWQASTEVVKETWETSDNTTYNLPTGSADRKVIDFVSVNRFYGRRKILGDYGAAYPYLVPKVYVNDVEQTSGYTCSWDSNDKMAVTFDEALEPSDVVTVSYRYGGSSVLTIKAVDQNGTYPRRLAITDAELQWTDDIEVEDAMVVELWGYVPHPDQQNFPEEMYGPVRLTQFVYDTIMDIFEEAREHYPPIPAVNGSRGCPSNWHDLKWDYSMGTSDERGETATLVWPEQWAQEHFAPKYNMEFWVTEMRVYLESNIAFGGTRCSFTLYGFLEPIRVFESS